MAKVEERGREVEQEREGKEIGGAILILQKSD